MTKHEMSCPHQDKITRCNDCMAVLDAMKSSTMPAPQAGDSGELRQRVALFFLSHPEVEISNQALPLIEQLIQAERAAAETAGRIDELKHLVADTLMPENVGGDFIHEEVREFAKQQKLFIDDRIAKLQGEAGNGQ